MCIRDRYLVKYLGVNAFTVYDSYQTFQNNQIRAEASPNDLKEVKSYIREHYAEPNDSMFGIAKGCLLYTSDAADEVG
ncbi:hypothetical protein KQJ29_33090, partial [Enterococcus sp. S181_ASV_20]|nr:hypothetical protein [Enterococcus sp. S181_ASV_20]